MKRSWIALVAVAAGLVILGILGSSGRTTPPLDPTGTGADGAKALTLLLHQYGATVTMETGVPGPATQMALLLDDELSAERRRALLAWVVQGGRLVVTDPTSPIQLGAPTNVDDAFSTATPHPTGPCALAGLGSIGELDIGPSLFLRPVPGAGGTACFPFDVTQGATEGTAFFLLSHTLGHGQVVTLGGGGLWDNLMLDHNDNAALAVDLLTPADGANVAVMIPPLIGSGTKSAYRLLSPRVKWSLLELLLAFVVLALWQGRRLGRPVVETQPVELAGSELVVAVGDLLARTHRRDAAVAELRADATRWLGERVGLGSRADPQPVADAVATRSGADRSTVAGLLADHPIPDDAALADLARNLADLRQEILHGPVR